MSEAQWADDGGAPSPPRIVRLEIHAEDYPTFLEIVEALKVRRKVETAGEVVMAALLQAVASEVHL